MRKFKNLSKIFLLIVVLNVLLFSTTINQRDNLDKFAEDNNALQVPLTSELPNGIIAMWSGTLDSIPEGWELCNGSAGTPDLTGRFIYGTAFGENPGAIGDSSEHNHTYSQVPSHDHSITDLGHSHDINASEFSALDGPIPWNICGDQHQCVTTFSPTSISIGYTGKALCHTENTTIVPPYYELAFVMKIDNNITIPKGIILMWSFPLNQIPEGWLFCNGSNNTPNMTGRFAKSIENGIDPGSIGGNREHNHNYSEVPYHTHSATEIPGHQHICNYDTLYVFEDLGGPIIHSICEPGFTAMSTEPSSSGITLDSAGSSVCTTNNASSMPPYAEVAYIMCEEDTNAAPMGVIGMWSGIFATIPNTYAICDGTTLPLNMTARFALNVEDGNDPGSYGGFLTHNHTYTDIPEHTHTVNDPEHVHTVYYKEIEVSPGPILGRYWDPNGNLYCHTEIEVSNAVIDPMGISVCTTNNASSLPPYYKLAFIAHMNSPPEAQDPSITLTPDTTDDLNVIYTYFDAESDPEGPTQIRWYKDGVLQAMFNDNLFVSNVWTNKSEEWSCTILPHDGFEYGALIEISSVTIVNSLPSISSASLGSSPIATDEDISLSYSFNDADNDGDNSMIKWYKNSVEQGSFENTTTINHVWTNSSDTWYAEVYPNDGTSWGPKATTSSISIENTAPAVEELDLSPNLPKTGDDLILAYSYFDLDNDQDYSWIRWYRDGIYQSVYDNQTTLLSSETLYGEKWNATLLAYDSFTWNNTLIKSETVMIQNTKPIITNVKITPDVPENTDNLVLSYDFDDVDGHLESLTKIVWYRNGVEQTSQENNTIISSSLITSGDAWYATLSASDGIERSTNVSSQTVYIDNRVPSVESLTIAPTSPYTVDEITLSYTFFDLDSDDDLSWIRWYRNGIHQSGYDNQTTLPASATNYGEKWNATLLAYDGKNWNSTLIASSIVTIQNSAPVLSNIQITPVEPNEGESLLLSYDYFDADGQTESGTTIRWYKNGELQSQYNDQISIPGSAVSQGDEWYVIVTTTDGVANSESSTSNSVSVPENSGFMKYLPYIIGGVATIVLIGIIATKSKSKKSTRQNSSDDSENADINTKKASHEKSNKEKTSDIIENQAEFCPICGKVVDSGTERCPSCGNDVSKKME